MVVGRVQPSNFPDVAQIDWETEAREAWPRWENPGPLGSRFLPLCPSPPLSHRVTVSQAETAPGVAWLGRTGVLVLLSSTQTNADKRWAAPSCVLV